MTTYPCQLCKNETFNTILTCTDHLVTNEKFEIEACTHCGFRRTKNFPSENVIGKYYESENYVSHSNTKKGIINSVYHAVRKLMLKKKANWVSRETGLKTGKLLDVGTGTGYFAYTMQNQGWLVSTVEKSDDARHFAEKNFRLKVYPSLNDFAQKEELQDVITLWHVLEHIEPLNHTMSQFYNLLAKNGLLVLALPNCNSYDATVYKENWAAYDVPRHLWHFTPKDIQTLAQKHGFELVKQQKMIFDGYYISMMSEKDMKSSFATLRGLLTGFRTQLSSLFNTSKSSSIVYFLRKR